MTFATADLCDAHGDHVFVARPGLAAFGGAARFHGPIATLACHEDNGLLRQLVHEEGAGRVLVVDGRGSLRCALLGGNLAAAAAESGWSGLIVHGCVRDVLELRRAPLGVLALASHPARPGRSGAGQRDLPVTFLGITFAPGHHLYADEDGLLVAPRALA